jgi:two-component system nitrate/nitrite sensor histidine kinase NarX
MKIAFNLFLLILLLLVSPAPLEAHRQTILYLIPYLISAAISAGMGLYAWQHRTVAGAIPFAWLALAEASTILGYTFELASPGLAAKIFWDNSQWVGMLVWPLAFLAFALQYTGRKLAHPKLSFMLLAGPVLIFWLLVLTDDLHSLIRPTAWLVPGEPFPALVYDFTFTVWAMALYSYGLTLFGVFILGARFIHSQPLYRAQIGVIISGALIPLVGTVLTLVGITLTFHRDTSPLTLALSNLVIAWGLFRYRLFDLVPVAREMLIERMGDMVIVLDLQNRIVDLNPAAQARIGQSAAAAIGQPATQLFSHWPDLVELYQDVAEARAEIVVATEESQHHFDLSISPLHDRRGRLTGRLIVMRDITRRAQIEEELRKHRERLAELVKERTAELTRANEHLKREVAERKQAEEALRNSERQLTQFLDGLPVGVAVLNASTNMYQYANQYARWLLNLPPQGTIKALTTAEAVEVLALYVAGTEHPYPADRLPSALALHGERVRVDDIEVEQAGRRVALEVWSSPIFDEQGHIQYAISAFQDITEHRQLAAQQARLREQIQHNTEELEQQIAERTAELAQETANLATLYRVSQEIVVSLELEQVYVAAHQAARQLMPVEAFVISLLVEAQQEVEDVYLFDRDRRWPNLRYPLGQGMISTVINTGQSLWLDECGNETANQAIGAQIFGYPEDTNSLLATPLRLGSQIIGAISAQAYPPRVYTAQHQQIFETLANQVSIAIANARLYAQAQQEIAERQRVEQELRFQKILLEAQNEATLDAILFVSQSREWLFFNQQFIEMWGISEEVVQSRSSRLNLQQVKDKVSEPDQFLTTVEDLYAHPDLKIQAEVALKDGRVFDYYSAPVRSKDGVYYGRVWYYRDMTERRQAEAALQQVNSALQQRIVELAALNRITQTLATLTELGTALEFVAKEITHFFAAFSAGISLFNEARTERTIVTIYQVQDREKLGLVGRVIPLTNDRTYTEYISQGKSLIIPDPQTSPYTKASHYSIQQRKLQCLMLIPLRARGEIIGTIAISTNQVGRLFTADEVALAETISGQIAGAIASARLFEQERRQRQIAESLRKVAMTLNRSLDREIVLTTIMDQLRGVIRYDSGSLFLQEGEELIMSKGQNLAERYVGHRISLASPNPPVQVFKQKRPLIIADVDADPHWQKIRWDDPIRSWMGAPLVIGQKVLGVLTADSFEVGAYTEEDALILQTFANQAAVAIENAQLYHQARQAAANEERNRLARNLHDSVTQALFSASLVAEVLPQIWQRDPDEARQGLEELRHLTKGALAEMRTLLLELRPRALLQARLDDLLRQLSQALTSQASIQVTVDAEPSPILPPEVQLTFYRIAQETFNNIVKHANATQVTINLRLSPPLSSNPAEPWQGCVALSICDNGRGFNPNHLTPDKLGLSIMRERSQSIDATLNIESQPGRGTQVTLNWQH